MKRKWMLIISNYDGLIKQGINLISGKISEYAKNVLPIKYSNQITKADLSEYNFIFIGRKNDLYFDDFQNKEYVTIPNESEGYSIYVGKSCFNENMQMIVIGGFDDRGVLYGCVDFCNKYCDNEIYKNGDIWKKDFFETAFDFQLNEWKYTSSPAIKTRAIWTWGHVIYDYRKFFENMLKLRLNEVVIWNDKIPFNATDVINYAHSLGIKVIWGFSWGWGRSCQKILENYNEKSLLKIENEVLASYDSEYALTNCDGIYFQSFTELHTEEINEKCIAETVVELVNSISEKLLKKNPDLHIQFGLHATSVKNNLKYIKNLDKRIFIIWEDCGSFPYNYYPSATDNFEETLNFTRSLVNLRGKNEKFGAVFKGMLKLDWNDFEHFDHSYILGERTDSYLKDRQQNKNKIWKVIQGDWVENADYLRKTVEEIASSNSDSIIQALIEDSVFENGITFPSAVYAELLWSPQDCISKIMGTVAKYSCVNFANV